ncbi:hypothetical protein [Priestia flexa]|uniref:hypothetical protein n=1 Tax=Priestia flexa TaxID=86664 RepID=UPI003FCF2310
MIEVMKMNKSLNDYLENVIDKNIENLILKLYKTMISIESDYVIRKMSELEIEGFENEISVEDYEQEFQDEKIQLKKIISKVIQELTVVYSFVFNKSQDDLKTIEKYQINNLDQFETVVYLINRISDEFYVNHIIKFENEMSKYNVDQQEYEFFKQLIDIFEMITNDLSELEVIFEEYLQIELDDHFDKELEDFEQELEQDEENI